jgi:hypothetical protein
MAFNPLESFNQGFASGERQKISGLRNALAGQIGQPGFDPSKSNEFQQYSAMDPDSAARILDTYNKLDEPRKKAIYQDARTGAGFLEKGKYNEFLDLAQNRIEHIERLGGDPSGTVGVLNMFNNGDIDGAINHLKRTEQIGIEEGFLKDMSVNKNQTTEQRDFTSMTEGLTAEEVALAKKIKLGLAPRAVGSSAQTMSQDEQLTDDVARSQAAIEAAKTTGKLQAEYKLKPATAKAVALATAEANLIGEKNKETRSNANALNVYDVAFKSLGGALGKTYTGPIAGLMPALTSEAQSADGAVSMILPTLKSVFRGAGEGTFTDSDQKLLTDMAPTRRDTPATIKFKMNAIDAIVRAKLGGGPSQTAQPAQATSSTGVKKFSWSEL